MSLNSVEDSKPEFDLDGARTAITGMSLISVLLEDFLVIMNSKPDVIISEEPYLSQMILVEVKSGMYIRRIWNRTLERGKAVTIDQLVDICNQHFFQGKPCIGCPQYRNEEGQEFVTSQTPIPRKISKYCHELLGSDASDEAHACPECLKLSESEEQTEIDAVTKCEVQIKSETEDWPDEKMFHSSFTNSTNEESIAENTSQACKAFSPSDKDDKGWHEGFPPNPPISEVKKRSCQEDRPGGKSRKLTYGKLIAEAINNSQKKMLLLSGIYAYINKHYPHFKMEDRGWQNSIRHNLSVHSTKFEKVPRKMGRGCFWAIKGGLHDIKDIEKEEDPPFSENEEGIMDAGNSKEPSATKKDEDIKLAFGTKDSIVVNLGGVKKMKCSLCEQEFHKHSLIRHAKEVHGMGAFNCRECMFKAQFVSEIVEHMEQEHEHIPSHEINCPTCKNNFEIFAITEHYKECIKVYTQEKVPVKCQWCEKVLASRASYSSHAKREHGRGKFVCPHCKFIAHFAEDLINHMEEMMDLAGHSHKLDISCPCCNNSYPPKEIKHHYMVCLKVHKSKLKYMRPIKCKTCKKVFKGTTCYKSHMLTHMRAEGIEESEAKVTLYHYCDKCGQRFHNKHQLIGHIRSVHDQIDYICTECPMTFKTQDKLYGHKKLVHSTDEKYNCKHCGKRFGQVNWARTHERSHENPQFQCRFCSKLFKSERSLEAHERVHTGEKAFSCKLCSAAFTWKGGLRQHEQGVHKIIGPKGGTGWLKKDKS